MSTGRLRFDFTYEASSGVSVADLEKVESLAFWLYYDRLMMQLLRNLQIYGLLIVVHYVYSGSCWCSSQRTFRTYSMMHSVPHGTGNPLEQRPLYVERYARH